MFFAGALYADKGSEYAPLNANSLQEINSLLKLSDSLVRINPAGSKADGFRAWDQLKNSKMWALQAKTLRLIGNAYQRLSKYDSAQFYLKQSIAVSEKHNEKKEAGYAYIVLARVYQNLEDRKHAEEYSLKGLNVFKQINDKEGILRADINVAITRVLFKEYNKALKILLDALKLNNDSIPNITDEIYNDIAVTYLHNNEAQNAIGYLRKIYSRTETANNISILEPTMDNLGCAYIILKKYDSAEFYLNKAMLFARKIGNRYMAKNVYHDLYNMRKAQGKPAEALDMFIKYTDIKDSVFNVEKANTIYDLEAHYQSREKEAQIKLLQLEKNKSDAEISAITQKRNLLILLVAIILAGAYFIYRRQKEKAARALERQENIEKELLDAKHQLGNFTQILISKNALILELSEKNNPVSQPEPDEEADSATDKEDLLNRTILTSQDWDNFKELFEKAHPGYMFRMKAKWPDLTAAELRFALLVKLGLDARQMSEMLGVSVGNIRQLRFRFRKKIGPESEEDIETLISKLN